MGDWQCRRWLALAILPALMVVGGCDTAWQAYDQIALGQPVPANNLLAKAGTTQPDQLLWSDGGGIPLPYVCGGHWISVLTGPAKRVVAKQYEALAMGHWLLAQTWTMRTVLEVQLPVSQPDQQTATSADVLSYVQTASGKLDEDDSRGWLELEKLPLFPQMLGDKSLGRWPSIGAFHVCDLAAKELTGLAKPGFDRRLTNRFGASARVRNLGGGIVRIEMNYTYVLDPLGLLAVVYMSDP